METEQQADSDNKLPGTSSHRPRSILSSPRSVRHQNRLTELDGQVFSKSATAASETQDPKLLSKLKRFLATLIQFGSDIGPETGQRVRENMLGLLSGSLNTEEFRAELQSATGLPLRPFVLPFLRSSLPAARREFAERCRNVAEGRLAPVDTERLLMHLLADGENGGEAVQQKRRAGSPSQDRQPPKKRLASYPSYAGSSSSNSGSSNSGSSNSGNSNSASSIGSSSVSPETQLKNGVANSGRDFLAALRCNGGGGGGGGGGLGMEVQSRQTELTAPPLQAIAEMTPSQQGAWRQLDALLSAITDLVGKAQKAMSNLQQMHYQQLLQPALNDPLLASRVLQKQQLDTMVTELRRQAQQEVQLAVELAEQRASQAMAAEKLRSEQLFAQVRQMVREERSAMQAQSSAAENCWNCGRQATDTCSGCGSARYCGNFCQHKDWQRHQRSCTQRKQQQEEASRAPPQLPKSEQS